MSTAAAKKKKQSAPALATTGRGAPFAITLGVVFLTMGLAFLFSLIADNGSHVLNTLKNAAYGIADILCPVLPLLLCWGGLKMLVSVRHKVAYRDILLISVIFVLLLTCFTLTAGVGESSGTTAYLDYISKQNYRFANANQDSYSEFLHRAYMEAAQPTHPTRGAGGLLGMLIAYPLWKLLSRIGALLFVILLLIGLFLLFFRIHPGEIIRRASDFSDRQKMRSAEKRQQKEMEALAAQQTAENACPVQENNIPIQEVHPSQAVHKEESIYSAPAYYQPAPIYQAAPAVNYQNEGFYPVQPDLHDERAPLHAHRDGAHSPLWKPRQPVKAEKETQFTPDPYPEVQETPVSAPAADLPPEPEEMPDFYPADPVAPEADEPIPEEAADDLPWDEEPEIPAPAAEKAVTPPAPVKETKIQEEPAMKPQPASSWASQVKQKQAEITSFPQHTTAKGDPVPVYTDPVMPITGERIAITPRAENTPKEEKNTRLDGTTPPKVRQTEMNLQVAYQAPPIRLLNESRHVSQADASQEDERRAQVIESTLASFGVESQVKQIMHGPSITRFAIQIAPGVKVSRVTSIADNLALELKTKHVRVEAPIQGTSYIGIEVPNALVSTVALREVLDSPEMRNNPSPLLVALGKDIAGAPILCDLSKMPHLLIAGATGSGKSVCINSIVCSLLYRTSPDQVRMIMIDPKQVELSVYNTIPHLLVPVVSDPRKASGALAWVVQEMLERYGKFSAQNVRNLAGYNKVNQGTDKVLPNIVVIIDEMADLMEVCRKDVEESIRRLAALARAAGIYMVLATQRPSVDVITGVIKNNIPSRIAFAVSSGTDSRTIIDINGAEKLMGKGDMLYKPSGTFPQRVQGCLVTDDEVMAVTEYIGRRYETNYDPNIAEHLDAAGKEKPEADDYSDEDTDRGESTDLDDLLIQAIEMAVEDGQASTSMLQRRLRVGYARAGRLIDEMEKRGIISHSEGSKPRKTLITREQYYEMFSDD